MERDKSYAIDEGRVAHNDFDDEVVVIQFATGNYYSLRATAATFWKQLSYGPRSPAALLSLFADPPVEAENQIAAFLAELCARDLIVESAAGQSAAVEILAAEKIQVFEKPQMEAFEDLQALLVADVIHDTDEQGWPHIAVDPAA